MKILHPQTHASVSPRALLLAPLAPTSPGRAAALGFALGLALTVALLPLAQRIGGEPSPAPVSSQPSARPVAPALVPVAGLQSASSLPEPARATSPRPNPAPDPAASEALPEGVPEHEFSESEIAEELFEGELPPGELPEADVRAGLAQARALCRQVSELGPGAWEPLQVGAIRQLLGAPAIEAESYGELPAIHSELDWIEGLKSTEDLGLRTLEDLRFLVGAIHWYLEGATAPLTGAAEHLDLPREYDAKRLREFRGMDYADLLAEWD